MNYVVHERSNCRICQSSRLEPILRFDDIPFTDAFFELGDPSPFTAPLGIFRCEDCRTVQTLSDIEVKEYYQKYRYTASKSPFAQRFMRGLAEACLHYGLKDGDRVIEIGSGDGYQLACFKALGMDVLGVEPSEELAQASEALDVPVVRGLFGKDASIPDSKCPVQAVLLTYTFDHLPEPAAMLAHIRKILDPERGILVIEVHDLAKIVERKEVCLFEHEHTIYLDAPAIARLLSRQGFKLLTLELVPENERRANSLLVLAAPSSSVFQAEAYGEMQELALECFSEDVRLSLAGLASYVKAQVRQGKRIAGYGAGGRGVMTLAMAGIQELVYLCDQNPSFHGLLAPKSGVQIASPERLKEDPVDEVIVFSFGYLEEIRELVQRLAPGTRVRSLLELL